MVSTTEKYELALAVKIGQGQMSVNGQVVDPDSKTFPEGVYQLNGYIVVPEGSLLDTVKDAIFYLHPANTARAKVSPDPYAEVHGNDPKFRICVFAPTATTGNNNTPVSYLHYYLDEKASPYLELQANEGCVKVAIPKSG